MSLRDTATARARSILNGTAGLAVTITNPFGTSVELKGLSSDIGMMFDPNTGGLVNGRSAHVTLSFDDLKAALNPGDLDNEELWVPRYIADKSKKPWLVQYAEPNFDAVELKVMATTPDRSLGLINCTLESY